LRQIALAATDWFAELAGHPPHRSRSQWWPNAVQPVIDGLAHLPGPDIVTELTARSRAVLGQIEHLPLTISHGDAGPVNVLMDDHDKLSVIDWEDCDEYGLPVGDLVALLTFLIFDLEDPWRTGRYGEAYRATLNPSTKYGSLRAECLARYARRVGIDPSTLQALALIPWMRRSLREHHGMLGAAADPEGREAFRRGLYVSLWQEQLNACSRS
jgi:hypothetical protein